MADEADVYIINIIGMSETEYIVTDFYKRKGTT
jgi:hypothetical protein